MQISSKQETAPPALDGSPPIKRVLDAGTWAQVKALLLYMTRTEVHTYAFSVAANAILSLFPFIVLMLTLTRRIFHSAIMDQVFVQMMRNFLPTAQDFVMHNMQILAHPHKRTQFISLLILLVTSTGVFLPLEVALNSVWGIEKNRSYLHNQLISLGLAFSVGVLMMLSVAFAAGPQALLSLAFLGHTENVVYRLSWLAVSSSSRSPRREYLRSSS